MNRETRLKEIVSQSWNLRSFSIPSELSKVPTMLSAEECRMLVWLAMNWSSGQGAVIDLGSFLGGSTAHLAYGLSQYWPSLHVDAFDLFYIADEHKEEWLYSKGIKPFDGNDFRHVFYQFVEPFGKAVAHAGQMEDLKWNGNPIEILFVDICKGWSTTRHVMREFYPSLVPGQSIVIQQDYQHYQHPWVVATTEAMKDHFELLTWTDENSVVFFCKKTVSQADVEAAIVKAQNNTFELIKEASEKFPHARQREAVWQHIIALHYNPNAQHTWDLSLR